MPSNTKNLLKIAAFTLAEVLIVLGIIGIIAEMTIPTLMNNVQDQVIKVSAKKQFSVLSQVLVSIQTDYGSLSGQCNGDHTCFRGLFLPYLRSTKTCESGADSDCITSAVLNSGWQNGSSVILSDGTAILFYSYGSDCTSNQTADYAGGACGEALIDLNGSKKPNTMGKDIIYVEFTETGLRFQSHALANYYLYS